MTTPEHIPPKEGFRLGKVLVVLIGTLCILTAFTFLIALIIALFKYILS